MSSEHQPRGLGSRTQEDQGDEPDVEDGEIKVFDDENYILSDSYFAFKWD